MVTGVEGGQSVVGASEPVLVAHDLFCLYATPTGHVAALRGLSLEVAAGERVVVHGPNGSGKTTLLRVLSGELAPSAGLVRVCGVELAGADERERRQLRSMRLGLVDQHHAGTLRPELDVAHNVALQLRLAGCPAAEAMDRARQSLAGLGLDALAARRPQTLSGGEAQRVAVCAAVAHGPSLLLADEPTGELDRESAEQVYRLLAAATGAAGASLVLVTHDTGAAVLADRVVRIRDGRLSEEWSPSHHPVGSSEGTPQRPDERRETLVVDDRGWVRLPERLRRIARVNGGVRARALDEGILLTTAARPGAAATDPAPGPAPDGVGGAAPRPPAGSQPAARLQAVRVVRAGREVLAAVDLEVMPGRLTVVRGPSGAGKTTLLRVATGLEQPASGRAILAGVDLAGLDRAARAVLRRDHVALAGQGGGLVDALDVAENLALARDARGRPHDPGVVQAWVDALGLHAVRHRRVGLLSGGERQRALVARVLSCGVGLVVLDEPTSQQDEANAERVVAVLRAAAATGTAVLSATHDPVLVDAAQTVLTLA